WRRTASATRSRNTASSRMCVTAWRRATRTASGAEAAARSIELLPLRFFGGTVAADHHLDQLVCDVDERFLDAAILAAFRNDQCVRRNSLQRLVTVDVHDLCSQWHNRQLHRYAVHCV